MSTIFGTAGDDSINGTSSDDWLYGLAGNDILSGGNGYDRLFGGEDNDILSGGAGRDSLNGGTGDDILTGGTGKDRFIFDNLNEGVDTITDFEHGYDVIALEGDVFTRFNGHIGGFEFQRFMNYDQATGVLEYDPDNDGQGDVIAILQPGTYLDAGDFLIV